MREDMKTLGCLAVLFLFVCPCSVHSAPLDWDVEEIIDPNGESELWIRGNKIIDVDDNCRPHVAYRDPSYNIRYARRDGSGWHTETVSSLSGAPCISLNSQGRPGLITASNWPDQPKYINWTGSAWQEETIDVRNAGIPETLVYDNDGYPHTTFYQHTGGGSVSGKSHQCRHLYYTGSEWIKEDLPRPPGMNESHGGSVTADSKGVLHFVYSTHEWLRDRRFLTYVKKDGDTWSTPTRIQAFPVEQGLVYPNSAYPNYASIVTDSEDNPHIIYVECGADQIGSQQINYFTHSGTAWKHDIVDPDITLPLSEGVMSYLAVDSKDYVHFTYRTSSYEVKYARGYTKGAVSQWEISTLADNGKSPSIAIDNEDKRHVAYVDSPNAATGVGALTYLYSSTASPAPPSPSGPRVITIQPGPDGKDTHAWGADGHTATNYGNSETLKVEVTADYDNYQAESFLQFVLSAIPDGGFVEKAELKLYMHEMSHRDRDRSTEVRQITEEWTENTLTWDVRPADDGHAWATLEMGEHGSGHGEVDEWFTWDVTDLVRAWHDGTHPNHGLMIDILGDPQGGPAYMFRSGDFGTAEFWPILEVTHVPEPGAAILLGISGLIVLVFRRFRRRQAV